MRSKKDDLRFYELLRDFLHKYLVVQRNFSDTTVCDYKESLEQYRLYLRDIKNIPFDKVGFQCFSKEFIYDFCIWLRDDKHRAVATINLRLSAIMSFLRYCGEEDPALSELYLKAKSIHRFKGKEDPKLEYLNAMQLEAIFACPDVSTRNGRRDQFFMIYAYETGGRIEELVNMKLGDIIRNGNSVQVRLHGKGDKTRYNPLPEEVIPYLDSYLSEFHPVGSNEDYLFYTIHGHQHTQMAPRTVNSFLAKYAAKLHEQDPNFPASLHCHVFRHSIGMAMYKAGIPLSYIRDFLGHSSLETVSIYAHADSEAMETVLMIS